MSFPRRLAIVDLGTNSIRFDVHEVSGTEREPKAKLVYREKMMVRLGEAAFAERRLRPAARQRTIEALKRIKGLCDALDVERITAFGTAALREARDRKSFLAEVKRSTGIRLRVLSGADEARLIARGVLAHDRHARGSFALIDIGGGSTEISVCHDGQVLRSASFPFGVARVQQMFLESVPPREEGTRDEEDPGAVVELRKWLRATLARRMDREDWPSVGRMIGSSGTVRAYAKLIRPKAPARAFRRSALKSVVERMSTMTSKELLKVPGMEPKRVDLIVAGGIVLDECMRALAAEDVVPTEYALRDGLILAETAIFLRQSPRRPQVIEALVDAATKQGSPEEPLRRHLSDASRLWEGTRSLRSARDLRWSTPFLAAAALRAMARRTAPNAALEIAATFARTVVSRAIAPEERERVAALCGDTRVLRNSGDKKAAKELSALLEMLEAFDPTWGAPGVLRAVQVGRDRLTLRLRKESRTELATLLLQQRKDNAERLFKKTLITN